MKKALLALFLLSFLPVAFSATSQWSTPGKITYMSLGKVHNYLLFQLSSEKVGGCQGRFYALDVVDEPMGQSMLSLLLSYHAMDKEIMVYTEGTCTSDYKNAVIRIIKTPGDNRSY